jgi:hypothetical protein
MRWEDERYVRVYTRDTVDWLALSFDAQALLCLLLRKVDRAGLLPLGKHGKKSVAIAIGHPREWARLEPALDELLTDGVCALSEDGGTLVFPNYIAAQEASASAVQRTREYRERERDRVRVGLPPAALKAAVIYFIQSEHGGPIKVGRADDLARRVMGLQTGRPDKLVVLTAAEGTRKDERDIHAAFSSVRERGEWFHPTPGLLSFVRAVSRDTGEIGNVAKYASGDAASHETSHVTPRVTPSRAVPSLAVPSSSLSVGTDEPEELPDATDDAQPVTERMASTIAAMPEAQQGALLPLPEKPKRKSGPDPETLRAVWNRVAPPLGFQVWEAMGDDRKRDARLALEAVPDLAKWEAWLRHELARPWNRGENDDGWKANVEWFLRKKTRNLVADFNPAVATAMKTASGGDVPRLGPRSAPSTTGDKPRL